MAIVAVSMGLEVSPKGDVGLLVGWVLLAGLEAHREICLVQ